MKKKSIKIRFIYRNFTSHKSTFYFNLIKFHRYPKLMRSTPWSKNTLTRFTYKSRKITTRVTIPLIKLKIGYYLCLFHLALSRHVEGQKMDFHPDPDGGWVTKI
jgi:hypothetical protein